MVSIRPRYYRWFVDPGVEWKESHTEHAFLQWEVPLSQCALVLLDVWDHHYLIDAEERAETIIRQRLKPMLTACREKGMTVIHAPGPRVARQRPEYSPLPSSAAQPLADVWPPKEFRQRTGPYAAYGLPKEAREAERKELQAALKIHPLAQPVAGEPVIATGDEMHALCKERGILFLLYAGFNTNACILERDYGVREFSRRGYTTILIRDCTTAMESADSQAGLWQTRAAIDKIEMFLGYTVTSKEVVAALQSE